MFPHQHARNRNLTAWTSAFRVYAVIFPFLQGDLGECMTRESFFSYCYLSSMNLCVLLLVGCLTYTTAASFPSITDITANTTLQNLTSTSAQTQSSNSAAEDEIWVWYCANNQRWSLPELKHDDCLGVLDYFWIETTDETARKSKEFRVPGARKKTTAPPQKTPQKYTFGKVPPSTMFLSSEVFHRICHTINLSRS